MPKPAGAADAALLEAEPAAPKPNASAAPEANEGAAPEPNGGKGEAPLLVAAADAVLCPKAG